MISGAASCEFMQLFHLFRNRHITAVISGSQSVLNHSILFILLGHSTSPAGLPVESRRKLPPPLPPAATAELFYKQSQSRIPALQAGSQTLFSTDVCLHQGGRLEPQFLLVSSVMRTAEHQPGSGRRCLLSNVWTFKLLLANWKVEL